MLDNALDNKFNEHLLFGKTMPLKFSSSNTQMQQTTNVGPFLKISRALTRIKDVYLNFWGPNVGVAYGTILIIMFVKLNNYIEMTVSIFTQRRILLITMF